jgi:hypothetical protein
MRRGKAVPPHTMEAQGREEVYFLVIHDLSGRWGRVASVTPRPRFIPTKRPLIPNVQEAGWALGSVWTQRPQEKSFASAGDRNLYRPVVQFVVRLYTVRF